MQTTKPASPTAALGKWVYVQRRRHKLTRAVLCEKTGVGPRFIRELEMGKPTVRLDKVCQVLHFFGHELAAVPLNPRESREMNGNSYGY